MSLRTELRVSDEFERVRLDNEQLEVSDQGELKLGSFTASELLARFGSPLYVVSEPDLRTNLRRIRSSFQAEWPGPVDALFAIKANNNLAIRRIMAQEGAGSDCFGPAELYATMLGGADPELVVLNGSNKSVEELRTAAQLGLRVNIDAEDEIEVLDSLARRYGRPIRVNLRLKTIPASYVDLPSDYFGLEEGESAEAMRLEKWGFSEDAARELIGRIQSCAGLVLEGFHHHIGRISAQPEAHAAWAADLAGIVRRLHDSTGFAPRLLDIGGGWPRTRDAESGTLELNQHPIEEYAAAVCTPLRDALEPLGTPRLFIEPGRFVVGSAVTLLCTVGAIKRDVGAVWINVDASTNNLMRIDTSGCAYHIFAAADMHRPIAETVRVVGPTCAPSVLSPATTMPELARGEPLAILDAGMYAETSSTQFNGVPRPATVLVCGDEVDVIKERETVLDVFSHHRIPERLADPRQST